MSFEIRIPIANDDVLRFWQAQAAEHGRSLEEEIGSAINKAAAPPQPQKIDIKDRLAALHQRIRQECGVLPDSTPLIRQERDIRG